MVVGWAALPDRPSVLLAGLVAAATGFFAASWNGIYIAEVARLSPPDQIAEVTSSSVVVTFLGYVLGPSIFSLLVTWSAGYGVPFALVAGQLAVMAVVQVAVLARRATR